MKKITLFLFLTLFVLQVQGQTFTGNGTYKISTSGLTPELYMTINASTNALEWANEITSGDDSRQVWTITNHRTPASSGLMEIYATVTGEGNFTMAVDDISGHPAYTLIARAGDPISVEADSGDYSGKDQFQRRKTSGDVTGNDALFVRTDSGTNARYGVIPSAAGDPIQFDGGGIDQLKFHFLATLSTKNFDASSIFISNPVNNQLDINGLTDNVSKVSVFSLLGQEVISRNVTTQSSLSIDVSTLANGLYIVELSGSTGKFTKKIVKQ